MPVRMRADAKVMPEPCGQATRAEGTADINIIAFSEDNYTEFPDPDLSYGGKIEDQQIGAFTERWKGVGITSQSAQDEVPFQHNAERCDRF